MRQPTARLPEGFYYKPANGSSICLECTFWDIVTPIDKFELSMIYCPTEGSNLARFMPNGDIAGTRRMDPKEVETAIFEYAVEAMNMRRNT